ncbi:MAG: recombinase RecA, partial [Candidatus Pacebacteria bacterium]|nr:recombinase RecA [Candidatus Paceibacterota bacterium]
MAKEDKKINDNNEKKQKLINETLDEIKRRFGEGAIMKLGETKTMNVEFTSTGSISLDIALGGGIPKGRIIEIYGPESSGKTTLSLHIVSELQKKDGTAAFVDAEHALDPEYAKRIGVKTNNLIISQPDSGEQALEIVEALVRSSAVDLVVIDSVAALTPKAEIEGEMGDSHMGLQARLMSQALRKLAGIVHKSNTTVVFINQIRMKIGIVFGNPETTTGGNALKFYSSVRI